MAINQPFLIGIGQDSHRFRPAKKDEVLTLGGLPFACGLTFVAHSDGDVILHALFNAISTALGGGSIGPTADPLFKQGITDSREYLAVILEEMSTRHYHLGNVSISLEGSKPHLEKYLPLIKRSLAKILSLEPAQIGVSITSGEDLSSFGQGEGLMATVAVILYHD